MPISASPTHRARDRFSHGLGAGDVNGDGRIDVLVDRRLVGSPGRAASSRPGCFIRSTSASLLRRCTSTTSTATATTTCSASSAHNSGIWWHEQTPDGWKTHEIDRSISQTHSLCLADINGDGLPDLVTGKRWWAHGPTGDEAPDAPAVMCWFELSRRRRPARPGPPHQIDDDSGVGTQFEVADVNGDGLLDVVTANKKGAHYFEQVRK